MEWQHGLSRSKGVRDLVDQSKPRAEICDVGCCREVADSIEELFAWMHIAGRGLKSCKLDDVSPEHKLVGVKYNPFVSAEVERLDRLVEGLVKVICQKESVINTFCFVRDVGDSLVKPS